MYAELLKNLKGLYILTKDGQLGVYDDQMQFVPDTALTAALQEHNLRMLQSYLTSKSVDQHTRIGLIFPTREERPWKTDTLFLEERVVRQLFPVGDAHAPLTAFQKKNQERSLFRGMESIVNFHVPNDDHIAFCPVLFDRNLTLDTYLPTLGRAETKEDATTPVIEVLNLVTDLPLAQRDTPAIRSIHEKIRAKLIQKERGHGAGFTLIHELKFDKDSNNSGYDADARADREITLSAADLDQLHITQRFDGVERWLEIPHKPVNPGHLRKFFQFRDLNDVCLSVLAARTLVYTAPSGTQLLQCGMTDKWNMYLLEGTVLLEATDGQSLTVEGGSQKAETPLSFLKPRKYKVTSLTSVSFLWIHDDLLRAVNDVRRFPNKTLKVG